MKEQSHVEEFDSALREDAVIEGDVKTVGVTIQPTIWEDDYEVTVFLSNKSVYRAMYNIFGEKTHKFMPVPKPQEVK